MLTEKQYGEIRSELEGCTRPLFFYHDDADGLCGFLLLYRLVHEGKGICVKSTPKLTKEFYKKVEEYAPDKIFIIDLALVDQEFIDECKIPIIWIDHHDPQDRDRVKYYNPRKANKDDNFPASYLCYHVVKQDMWISMLGCVGDWFLPDFSPEFTKDYPDLLPANIDAPEDALFETKLGTLIKMISFILKGKVSDVNKCVNILTRLKSPEELLDTSLPHINFLTKRYSAIQKEYDILLDRASKEASKGKLFVFSYQDDKISLTKELSNELLHRFPDKVLIVCREKSGEMKCSIRSKHYILPPIIKAALVGLKGFGGGHEHACGAVVANDDFETFVENIRNVLD